MIQRRTHTVAKAIRCAIYTRKSTQVDSDQEFNTLDAQRECAERYIDDQPNWICLPDHYDDGGFSGGNIERPALKRLMADVEAGKINCVVVYKYDRFSRSLLDFAKLMETFEHHKVSFVAVSQQFDTSTSMGRLYLNMLMSFAQFEREMISDRTRDKIAATRRKGMYSGGMPILGYDVINKRLIVNGHEAERVREIFALYLRMDSLLRTVDEINRHGWLTKSWVTRKGNRRGGLAFNKSRLHYLLTNPTYIGKIAYKSEIHEGEHEAIVDAATFEKVAMTLEENGRSGSAKKRNKHGALLRGLLRCASCDCGMTHTFTSKGNRRYRYYVCNKAQQLGRTHCPAPSVPAAEIERFIVDEIKIIGQDPALIAGTLAESKRLANDTIQRLKRERAALERQRRADEAELFGLAGDTSTGNERVSQIQHRVSASEFRLAELGDQISSRIAQEINETDIARALTEFNTVWNALTSSEQAEVLGMLIERIAFDGRNGNLRITFRPLGIKALAERGDENEETAA